MNIQELAQEMGVKEQDIENLLTMVCTSMDQDGISESILEMSESERVDVVNAYIQSEVKKFSDFCVTLLTNTEKKAAFDLYLLSQLKED